MAKWIYNLTDLAHHVGAATVNGIAHRLYKDTECGISFLANGDRRVTLTGYCEGSDRWCPPHSLDFPFSKEEFDAAVDEADRDGCDTWDETHGCAECGPEDVNGDRAA